jgi:hypothetical protein
MSGTMPTDIIVGVDTHKHTHAAVAVTGLGACVAERTIKVGLAGYRELEAWARSLGNVRAFGIEGTGSYGAGLARFVPTAGCAAGTARRITSMPRAPPAPCSAARPRLCPRPAPAGPR